MSCYSSYRSSSRSSSSSYRFSNLDNVDEMFKQARNLPFFGKDIGALTYLAWEKEVDKIDPWFYRESQSYVLSIYLYKLEEHAREWWDERQHHVRKGRKSTVRDWSELKACMRRKFVPSNIKRNL